MNDDNFGDDERLRQALHGYATRFEPVQDQWARIEGRHAVANRLPNPRHNVASLAAMAVAAAVVVLLVGMLVRPEQVRSPAALAFADAGLPQYAGVERPRDLPAGSTMAEIQRRGFIRVGIKFDQPRFGEQDPDTRQVEGFDAEIAKLLAVGIFGGTVSESNGRIRWVRAVSGDRESLLQSSSVDIVVATYSITPKRAESVSFAGPYYRSSQDIMVRTGDTSIRGVDDLTGRLVCTAQGSTSYDNLVRHNPNARPVVRATYSECAQALADGEVDAVTTDLAILAGFLRQGGGTFKVLNNPFTADDERYGVGLRKGDEVFRSFLNRRLQTVADNGDWARAFSYTLSDLQGVPPQIDGP